MSSQRVAVLALTGLLVLLPTAGADAYLKKGMHGRSVKKLQLNLSRAGFHTFADGAFGPATKASLMRWERWRGRRVDGVATRRDRRALRRSARFGTRLLRQGMRGRDVRGLQYYLNRRGAGLSRDGAFGPMTRAAVASWESRAGRRADGVATRPDQHALQHARGRIRRAPAPSRPVHAWISRRGFAHAPGAPARVRRMIRAGNRIAKKPYKYGGGHGSWNDSGYDCSGSVSYALHGAGLVSRPRDSGEFMSWGASGRGDWITIYANSGHVYMMVAGIRFDTSGRDEDGTRWHDTRASRDGYAVRHPSGL